MKSTIKMELAHDDAGEHDHADHRGCSEIRTEQRVARHHAAIETLGEECGVGLITRELSSLYPFVRTR